MIHFSFVIKKHLLRGQPVVVQPSRESLCLPQRYNLGCRLDEARLNLPVKCTSSLLHSKPGCSSRTRLISHQWYTILISTQTKWHICCFSFLCEQYLRALCIQAAMPGLNTTRLFKHLLFSICQEHLPYLLSSHPPFSPCRYISCVLFAWVIW